MRKGARFILLTAVVAVALAAAPPVGGAPTSSLLGPFKIADNGDHPQLIVDQLGTAHVVWNEVVRDGADVLHYCQIPRGRRACSVQQSFVPPEPGEARFNKDSGGPKIIELGPDQIALITSRYPNVVTVEKSTGTVDQDCFFDHHRDQPDACFGSSTKNWIYRSTDGGATFGEARVLSHSETPAGAPAMVGPQNKRLIGLIGDVSGGSRFQAADPEHWTNQTADMGDEGRDRNYFGSVGTLRDGRPVTAFTDLTPTTYYRVWGGKAASYNDIAGWNPANSLGTGDDPRLASGPRGLFLMNRVTVAGGKRAYVVRHYAGAEFGAARAVSEAGDPYNRDIVEDPSGAVHVAWVQRTIAGIPHDLLRYRLSRDDGATWSTTQTLATGGPRTIWDVDLGAADDGGGFAVFSNVSGSPGQIRVVPFGTSAKIYDLRVNGIEVTQGVQEFNLPVRDHGNPAADVRYHGADLEDGGKTVARVYANSLSELPQRSLIEGFLAATPIPVVLYGFRNGKPLPGSPLTAEAGPRRPSVGGLFDITDLERGGRGLAYTFTLPWGWAGGDVTLRAEVNPARFTPSLHECSACVANNAFTLTGVHFKKTGYVSIVPLAIKINGRLPAAYPDPGPIFAKADAVTPLHFFVQPYSGVLDFSDLANATSVTYSKCFLGVYPCSTETTSDAGEVKKFVTNAAIDRLSQWGRRSGISDSARYIVGVERQGKNIGGFTNAGGQLYGDKQPISVVEDYRLLSATAHELHHGLGRVHAGLKCGSNDNGQVGEPWPPGDWGYLDGYGLDTSTPSPYKVIDPNRSSLKDDPKTPEDDSKFYDLMSYCANGEGNSWISVRNWNRALNFHAPAQRSATRTAGPDRPLLDVSALENGAQSSITGVRRVTGAPTATAASGFRLRALDAEGRTLAEAGMTVEAQHVEGATGFGRLEGQVDASGARAVDVVAPDNTVIAERRASAHPPAVRLTAPQPRARVGGGTPVTIRWAASDADRDALVASVDFSADGGRSWKNVFIGPDTGLAVVQSIQLPSSRTARLRITVNDGFDETSAVSGTFRSLGAPPQARISSPAPGQSTAAGAALSFEGQAWDEKGRRVATLTWFDGKHRIGRGERITTADLPAGLRHVRLVARDADRRSGSTQITVRVTPVQPLFTVLKAPERLSRGARFVSVRVASTVPAVLRAGGTRFAVSRAPRSIRLRVVPGRRPLKLLLTLSSGSLASHVTLVIARG